jgi:hypothetical protein
VILIVAGVICLLISGYMMYQMIPRDGEEPVRRMESESGETAMALGQFILLIAGLTLLVKGIF